MIIVALFAMLSLYSCVAAAQQDPHYPGNPIKTAGNVINVSKEVNMKAKAVPMRSSINSPYAELKPAFSPKGDKLYFSRISHPNNTNGMNDMEDIWYSNYDSMTNEWSEPIRMPGFLNNDGPNF